MMLILKDCACQALCANLKAVLASVLCKRGHESEGEWSGDRYMGWFKEGKGKLSTVVVKL